MNLDLLKKLIKLANNNPNDNEANLAARKVCKMIEADEFKLVGGDDIRRRPQVNPQPAKSYWDDLMNRVRKSQEQSNPFNRTYEGTWSGFDYDNKNKKATYNPYTGEPQKQETNYNPQEPTNKTDTFHANERTVTVTCRKCQTKFKMSYEEYFGSDNLSKRPRHCNSCRV